MAVVTALYVGVAFAGMGVLGPARFGWLAGLGVLAVGLLAHSVAQRSTRSSGSS